MGAPWGGSTNFEAAYDLILKICLNNGLKREDMPSLIVFSDMQVSLPAAVQCPCVNLTCGGWQFNEASDGGGWGRPRPSKQNGTMFDAIKAKVAEVAKKLGWDDSDPTPMVFWNLRNTGRHPVSKDTPGTVMLSG